ncbi:dTDP-4-dehydrorhamnose reductase family protein [Vibrio breoganii]|uniref:dTDP-4-dehydrorhamnose reductase family protein n=1 Tax=Vibrio breoganii TaxID=553239 RepID=UPI00030AEBCD|nr:SDR family oxidoreductase [Vibrio breoganii]OED98593.1 hypothetical protein A1QE_00995 [Vibrio breoganii ZF-55]
MKKILILGTSGMLGNSIFSNLPKEKYSVTGIQRSQSSDVNIKGNIDALDNDLLLSTIEEINPDVLVNCIGVIKQNVEDADIPNMLSLNSILPHKLCAIAERLNCKFIHFSTDCVFDGALGNYKDNDEYTSRDIYGVSKYFGEIKDSPNTVTLRTSIIGHGIEENRSLIDWFLNSDSRIKGFSKAVFSGFPCCEIANILDTHVINNNELCGLYNLSSNPINKHDLLTEVNNVYELNKEIVKDESFKIDRSLNSELFQEVTGYKVPSWPKLIKDMYLKDYKR